MHSSRISAAEILYVNLKSWHQRSVWLVSIVLGDCNKLDIKHGNIWWYNYYQGLVDQYEEMMMLMKRGWDFGFETTMMLIRCYPFWFYLIQLFSLSRKAERQKKSNSICPTCSSWLKCVQNSIHESLEGQGKVRARRFLWSSSNLVEVTSFDLLQALGFHSDSVASWMITERRILNSKVHKDVQGESGIWNLELEGRIIA